MILVLDLTCQFKYKIVDADDDGDDDDGEGRRVVLVPVLMCGGNKKSPRSVLHFSVLVFR